MTEEATIPGFKSPVIKEEMHYIEENGLSNGTVTITFSELPEIILFSTALSKFCKTVHAGGLQTLANGNSAVVQNVAKTPEKPKKTKEPKEKRDGPVPKHEGFISSWEYKHIKASTDFEEMKRDYWKRFPKTTLTKEKLEEIWIYYHPKGQEQREQETPAARTEDDPKPGDQIGVNSKVVQVKGLSPAPGVGTVRMIKKDGVCKVEFFNHVKVLPIDHFALATSADINKARV